MRTNETDLARHFIETLRSWLTAEQLATVVTRNATSEYARACASHDFCDANEAMAEAYQTTFDVPMPLSEDEGADRALVACNSAWALARSAEFDVRNLPHDAR